MACIYRSSIHLNSLYGNAARRIFIISARNYSSSNYTSDEIASLLARPTWSARYLLPSTSRTSKSPSITPQKLHHLLRLSALPQPADEEEEAVLLETLESQIHFVKQVQHVDTTRVEPLRSIRDETDQAVKESTIGLDDLREAMAKERVVGRSRRIHRIQTDKDANLEPEWDGNALGYASKTVGEFFVVQTGN